MTAFSYETTVPVRFQDYDAMGHVNNAVYATYLEEARTTYLTDALGVAPDDLSTVLAHLELDFVSPLVDEDVVTVGIGTGDVGETSYAFHYELADDDGTVATGETVQVWVDPETGSAVPIPDELRAALESHTDIPAE